MKILLTNHFLADFTGSEVACLDLALALQDMGHQVTLACFEQGEPLLNELKRQQIPPVALSSLVGRQFDLIWAHHFTTLDCALFELGISATHIIFSSLSPYEPLESPPLCSERVNLFLANSSETQTTLLDMGLAPEQVRVFANPVAEPFFAHVPRLLEHDKLTPSAAPVIKLALVSNHVPPELSAALPLLAEQGVKVVVFGREGQQCLINAELLSEFNGIISIGRTVQYGLAMGLPVFCYDHFAGPGWLTPDNVERAAAHNFAGRCTPQRQTPEQLVAAIVDGFNGAQQAAAALRPLARARYRLTEQLAKVLQIVLQPGSELSVMPTARSYQAMALRQRQHWQRLAHSWHLQLYSDIGQGFNERLSVRHDLTSFHQQVSLSIQLDKLGVAERLRALRIDPLNIPCVVQLQRITLVDDDYRHLEVAEYLTSNALFSQAQRYYFMSYDPQLWLVLDEPLVGNWQCIEIELEVVATEEAALAACQAYVVQQRQRLAEQAQQYQQLIQQHDQQYQRAEHLNDALQQIRQHPVWRSLRALRQLRDRIFKISSNKNQ